MAEELKSPSPIPPSSETSPLCLKRRINLTDNTNQQPLLTLSPPPPPPPFLTSSDTIVDEIQQGQQHSLSPKKPKWSSLDESPVQEIENSETEGCGKFSAADEAGSEVLGGNCDFVHVSDKFLNSGSEFLGCESEKFNDNTEENGVERDNLSKIDGLGFSCKNSSENQFVVDVVGKGNDEFESENHNKNSGGFLHKLVKKNGGGNLKGDALTCSLQIEVIDETALVDVLKNDGKKNKRRARKGNANSIGVAVGASNGGRRKFVYSRKEMEAMRFVNVKGQKKFWQEIYNGFAQSVKKEYDELGNLRHHKHGDGRQAAAQMRNYNGHGILGESSSENMTCDAEIIGSTDFTCDGENSSKDGDDLAQELSEHEESDDEYENIQRPAFWVEGEPDFDSGPPEDGFEYLRRVRWEAKHIPKVKVVKIDNSKLNKEQSVYMPKIPDIEECPPHLLPLKQWEDEFVADFSELRMALSRLEDNSDTMNADPETIIIFGHQQHTRCTSPASFKLQSGGPTLSTVLDMDPVTRVAVLKRRISLFGSASDCDISKDDCAWLFALCAVIDTPLDPDTSASLRCLLRRCAKLRAGKSELDEEVVMLNVLATISGKIFGQSEK